MIFIGKAVRPIKDPYRDAELLVHLKKRDKRIYILYLLLRYTAFRVSDIINLRVCDVLLNGNKLTILEQKTKNRGKTERTVILEKKVIIELEKYCMEKGRLDVLFPSQKGYNTPITKHYGQKLLKRYGEEIGIKDLGTHTGRKTASYNLWESTQNIKIVKKYLGHDETKDTWKYVDIEDEFMIYANKGKGDPLSLVGEFY